MKRGPLPAGFGSLWLAVAVDAVGFGIVLPILPLYADRFDASPATIGFLLASFSLAQFVSAPRWGRLSDRYGRRPALLVSLTGTTVGALLTAAAPNLAVVFLGRIVDGASGGTLSVAQAAVSDIAPTDERPRLLGLLGAAFGLGFVAGPAIGGLASLAGHRAPFLLAGLLTAGNVALTARRVRETRPARANLQPTPRRRLDHGPSRFLAVAFLSTAAFAAFETTFALLAAHRFGFTAAATSLAFVGAGLVVAIATGAAAHSVSRRLGDLTALRLGLGLDAVGLALLAVASSRPGLAAAVALVAIGHGVAAPTLAAAVSARVSDHARGAALGAQQAAASLARIAGPVLAGATFALLGPTATFLAAAALASASITATAMGRERPVVEVVAAIELAA